MKLKSIFTILEMTKNLILIRDETRRFGCMSVTNDAEAVVEHLYNTRTSANRVIYYIDTDDMVDILEHDNCGNFTGFKHGYDTLEDFYENFESIK